MEFYLVSDLGCDLVVFHPYRTLLTLCGREAAHVVASEAGEVGVGIDNGPRYWGTGEGRLELEEGPLQTAWHVISFSLLVLTADLPARAPTGSSSTTHIAPSFAYFTHHI